MADSLDNLIEFILDDNSPLSREDRVLVTKFDLAVKRGEDEIQQRKRSAALLHKPMNKGERE